MGDAGRHLCPGALLCFIIIKVKKQRVIADKPIKEIKME